MKTFTIGWLNKCRCGNKSHTVKTARGNESALWDDDAVKCNSCGRGGVIQVCEGQARVLWETDEEMEEGKPRSTITKERAQQIFLGNGPEPTASEERELARIALASLEAKSRKLFTCSGCGAEGLDEPLESKCHCNEDGALWVEGIVYTVPPAPVSVPDFPEILPCPVILEPGLRFGKGVPTKAMLGALQRRAEHYAELEAMTPEQRAKHDAGMKEFAAMLQGADRPQNETQNIPENIPATQFKPVADLYGLTSPTGGETSFTFDAVEARDFIDGGWSCQEYVELERFQEAITNHTEDKLAMVDHSGDSNNMVEPVTTAYKLRDAVETIRNSGIEIDAEKIFAERDALNAPDCWCRTCRPVTISDMRFVVCPECGNKRCPHANDHRNACTGSNEPGQEGSAYPAAPQQEVTQALAKGMERYGDAMRELAKKEEK
ncbi:hypothetical protein [Escherichia coli]|uniref:hypothetical protein n=1 Tax=Escherichia coli TaxID=562 RepID=UPI002A3629E6|nr:hypothetical protein [Escherichia coli]